MGITKVQYQFSQFKTDLKIRDGMSLLRLSKSDLQIAGATPNLIGNVVLESLARGQQERARQEMRPTNFIILTILTRWANLCQQIQVHMQIQIQIQTQIQIHTQRPTNFTILTISTRWANLCDKLIWKYSVKDGNIVHPCHDHHNPRHPGHHHHQDHLKDWDGGWARLWWQTSPLLRICSW